MQVRFLRELCRKYHAPDRYAASEGTSTRTNGLDDFIFFFNNSEENAKITLPKAMFSIIDSAGKDTIELKPFEMDIVRK